MKTLCLLFLLILPTAAWPRPTLSWDACVDLVSKNNAELRSAIASQQSTGYQEGVSRSGFLPKVTGDLGYARSGEATNSIDHSYSATVAASENVFAGFQDIGKVKQAGANTEAAAESLKTVKAKVSFDLKSAFEGLLYAKEYNALTQEIIERREANLRLVDLRFQSGRENKGSFYLSQAYLNQAKYDDLQAQDTQRASLTQLAQAIGLDDFSGLDVQGTIPSQEPDSKRPDFEKMALGTPDYRQASAQATAADAAITVARSPFFPSLDLSGNLGRQAVDFFPGGGNRWSVGLNLSLPFFSGGKDFYSVKSAVESWSAADDQQLTTARSVLVKLEQAYDSYVEAVAKLKVDESFRQAALVRAEIARGRYNNGLMTFDDWDIIENDLISRQKTYLQSKRDRVLSEAAWEQAQGKGAIR